MDSERKTRRRLAPECSIRRGDWKQGFLIAFLCVVWLMVFNPWWTGWLLLPVALAMSLLTLGAGLAALRVLYMLLAMSCGLWAFVMAILHYPLIVVADSDLGMSARAVTGDYATLSCLSFGVSIVLAIAAVLPWSLVRFAIAVSIVTVACSMSFCSLEPSWHTWQAFLMVVGLNALTEGWGGLHFYRTQWRSARSSSVVTAPR